MFMPLGELYKESLSVLLKKIFVWFNKTDLCKIYYVTSLVSYLHFPLSISTSVNMD